LLAFFDIILFQFCYHQQVSKLPLIINGALVPWVYSVNLWFMVTSYPEDCLPSMLRLKVKVLYSY